MGVESLLQRFVTIGSRHSLKLKRGMDGREGARGAAEALALHSSAASDKTNGTLMVSHVATGRRRETKGEFTAAPPTAASRISVDGERLKNEGRRFKKKKKTGKAVGRVSEFSCVGLGRLSEEASELD